MIVILTGLLSDLVKNPQIMLVHEIYRYSIFLFGAPIVWREKR